MPLRKQRPYIELPLCFEMLRKITVSLDFKDFKFVVNYLYFFEISFRFTKRSKCHQKKYTPDNLYRC